MIWFHLTVEEFEEMCSPKNAELVIFEYDASTDEYNLITNIERKKENVLKRRPIIL